MHHDLEMIDARTWFESEGRHSFGGRGVVAGAIGGKPVSAADDKESGIKVDPALLLKGDPNVCRGLNACKGKGKGSHSCAGQASCAAVKAHDCAGVNDCKGQGGCGGYPGQNTCKGHGHCAVPLGKDSWTLARKQFEQLMKDAGKKVGAAPKAS